MRGRGAAVLDLLHQRDRIEAELAQLTAQGLDLRAERGRLQVIDGELRRRAALLLQQAQTAGGLAVARAQVQPDRSRWWWFLDELVAQQRRARTRRIATTVVVVLALIGVTLWLDSRLGLSGPERRAYAHLSKAENEMRMHGDVALAIREVEQAVAENPTLAIARVRLAALYLLVGRDTESRRELDVAADLSGNRANVERELTRSFLIYGESDRLITMAGAQIQQHPDDPWSYFLRASAYEEKNDLRAALDDLDVAIDLATSKGEQELLGLAQSRRANVVDRMAVQMP